MYTMKEASKINIITILMVVKDKREVKQNIEEFNRI